MYVLVQFFPLLVLPLMLWLFAPRYTRTRDLVLVIACYGLAKLLELADKPLFAATGGMVSGHTLKHLAAGAEQGVAELVLLVGADREGRPRRQPRTADGLEELIEAGDHLTAILLGRRERALVVLGEGPRFDPAVVSPEMLALTTRQSRPSRFARSPRRCTQPWSADRP